MSEKITLSEIIKDPTESWRNSSCIKTLLATEKQCFNKKLADLSGNKRGI